jgi:phosphate transport system substrate-binding protein
MRRTSLRARRVLLQLAPVIVVATLVGIAASDSGGSGDKRSRKRDGLTGTVALDGTAAMRGVLDRAAQRFHGRHPGVRVTVGASGDQSAIGLFCAGEVDVAAVARSLDRVERRACRSADTRYVPVEVAREGIAIVVSNRNRFASCLGLDQVKAIWRHGSPATSWAQIDPSFPPLPLQPVGSKPDSPPATLLAEALFGPVDPLVRTDYLTADDPKELSRIVASSPNALGYLPLTQLKPGSGVRPLAIDTGGGCVLPTAASVRDGGYRVLSRPLYLDLSLDSLKEPENRRFVREFLSHPPTLRASDGAIAVARSHSVYRKFTRP